MNARTDVLLKKLVPAERALAEVLARAERYARAGADGLFVPLIVAPDAIRTLTDAVRLPVNVLATAGLVPAAELRTLGVRRLSAGSAIGQVALAAAQGATERFLSDGDSAALLASAAGLRGMNALLKRP